MANRKSARRRCSAPGHGTGLEIQMPSKRTDAVDVAVSKTPPAVWAERLLTRRRIDPETGCWLWMGNRIKTGYGKVRAGRELGGRRSIYVHRLAAAVWFGEQVGDSYVCHKCDNPPCFNPEHLFVGTAKANAMDMAAKGRAANRSTLTDDDVRAIHARAHAGEDQGRIAADYGIERSRVCRIKNGQRFAWVTRDVPAGGCVAHEEQTCRRCGRVGTQRFKPVGLFMVCAVEKACRKREDSILDALNRRGHRIDQSEEA